MVKLPLILLVSLNVYLAWGQSLGGKAEDTYICENSELTLLKCDDPKMRIKVQKVLYGRQRMDLCNPNRKKYTLDCYSQSATSFVIRHCNEKERCNLRASNAIFTDPCTGVPKYLWVRWSCMPTKLPKTVKPWALKPKPRAVQTAVEGGWVKMTCLITFTNIVKDHSNLNATTIVWNDITKGNRVYMYDEGVKQQTKGYEVMNDFSNMDRIRSVLNVSQLEYSTAGDGVHKYECQFREKADLNSVLLNIFEVKVTPRPTTTPKPTTTRSPTTTTTTASTTTSATTTTISTTKLAADPTGFQTGPRLCDTAKGLNISLCAIHARCFDSEPSSYGCQCQPGFEGNGYLVEACQRLPENILRICPFVGANAGCTNRNLTAKQVSIGHLELRQQLEDLQYFNSYKFSAADLTVYSLILANVIDGFDQKGDKNYAKMMGSPESVSKELRKNVTKVFVKATSNVMKDPKPWMNQQVAKRRNLAMKYVRLLETTCMLTTRQSAYLNISDPIIDVQVAKIPEVPNKPMDFKPGGKNEIQLFTKPLPKRTDVSDGYTGSSNKPRIVFVRYKGSIQEYLSDDAPKQNDSSTKPQLVVFSDVISATASEAGLVSKIRLKLTHSKTPNASVAKLCAFWNTTSESWDSAGCRLINSTQAYSLCECNHLTSFAILLDYSGATKNFSKEHKLSLSIITYIGCILSIFCCIFGVWTYDILRRSKGDRMNSEGRTSFIIYEMICLSLLIAQTIFLMGIYHTKDMVLCRIVAAALHYFFLLLFEWMLMAGVYYILVYTQPYSIVTLDSHRCLVMIGLLLIPAVIVGVSLGLRFKDYSSKNHCWLSVENGLIWAFVGPVTAMLSINMILLSILIVLTWKIKPSDMLESGEVNKGWVTSRARKLRYELLFCIVLGATWIFGYLLIENTSSLVFSYIFAILNSLQGVFILISYANWSRIRAAYIAEFRRKRWLPESFRRWLHSRQYSPGGPPGVGMVGSTASATASQRTRSGRGSGSHRGLLSGTVNAHASVSSGALSHTTRTTRLGSGSSGAKWSISAGGRMDANENSVAMVTETEAAYNENYAGHSMMDEPRQVFSDFDDRLVSEFASQSDAEILNMTAALPLREHEEGGDHHPRRYSSSSSSSVAVSASTTSPSSSYSDERPPDDQHAEPPKLPVVCSVPSPFAVHHSAAANANGDCAAQTAPRMARRGGPEEEENGYLMPTTRLQRHTLGCRGRERDDGEVRASLCAKQKRFSQSDLYANADDVVYYSEPPLEPSTLERGAMGLSRVTDV